MCGIVGVFHLQGSDTPVDEALLRTMADTMRHRGPDGEGVFCAAGVGLAMRRLSIIDLEGGWQPIANETGAIQVIQNGEIYNHLELRRELEGKGHRFRTRSDTEALVHSYEEWGDDFLEHLNGMFAVAVYDSERRRLVVARDRLGIKPLYYTLVDGWLLFASELKALLPHPLLEPRVDPTALDLFLTFEYVPAPYSILAGVKKLAPGHRLVAERGRLREERWWGLPCDGAVEGSLDENAERVRDLLEQAVDVRRIADVPLGAFLSGGVDSSAIVAFLRRLGQEPLRTFSIAFEDPSYDESHHARRVADHFATEHHVERITPDAGKLFHRLMRHTDEPFADLSLFPTFLVSEIARRSVKVVLSGDGGDELFAGYHTYRAQDLAGRWQRLPALLRRPLERLLLSLSPSEKKRGFRNSARRFVQGSRLAAELRHMRWMAFLDDHRRAGLYAGDLRSAESVAVESVARLFKEVESLHPIARCLHVDQRLWLPDDILTKVDRMSMAVSLEARVPFLDHRLVEAAARIPIEQKIAGKRTKIVLHEAIRGLVPEFVHRRAKEGFSIPMKNWLRGPLRELGGDLLAAPRLARHGYFDAGEVRRLWDEHQSERADHTHNLFPILAFEVWYDTAFEATASAAPEAPRNGAEHRP